MIKRLYIDGYKGLVSTEIFFKKPLTLLYGPSGCGKSSVLQVLSALKAIICGHANVNIFPKNSLTSWATKTAQTFEIDIEIDNELMKYKLLIKHTEDGRYIYSERFFSGTNYLLDIEDGRAYLQGRGMAVSRQESMLNKIFINEYSTKFVEFMKNFISYDILPLTKNDKEFSTWLHSKLIAEPTSVQKNMDKLEEMVSRYQKGESLCGFNEIVSKGLLGNEYIQNLRDFIPGCTGVTTRDYKLKFEFEKEERKYLLGFEELSDGEKMLAIYLALPFIEMNCICFEEPTKYMDLASIGPWSMTLLDMTEEEKVRQIILTSSHPEIIDHFALAYGIFLGKHGPEEIEENDQPLKLSELLARGWLGKTSSSV